MLDIAPSVSQTVSPGTTFSFTSFIVACLMKGYDVYLTCEVGIVVADVLVEVDGVGVIVGLLSTAMPSLVISMLCSVFSSVTVSSPIINDCLSLVSLAFSIGESHWINLTNSPCPT